MKVFKDSIIIILPIAILVLFGFALTATGAKKTVSHNKTIINKSKSIKVIPKAVTNVRVPNLIGKTEIQAKKMIKKLGFKIGKIQI